MQHVLHVLSAGSINSHTRTAATFTFTTVWRVCREGRSHGQRSVTTSPGSNCAAGPASQQVLCIPRLAALRIYSSAQQVPGCALGKRSHRSTSECLAPVNCTIRRRLPFRSLGGLPTPSVGENSPHAKVLQFRTSADRDLPELLLHLVQAGRVATATTQTQQIRLRSRRLSSPMYCTLRTQPAPQVCVIK